ncbi:MAG: hypothetical protein ACI9DC_002290 [Gammaproteobacteria bacterium]|jgi:hypothetical protein
MNPAVAIIIALCVLFSICWLIKQPRAAALQTLTTVLVVGGVFAVLLALISGRIHPGFAAMGAGLLVLRRLLAMRSAFSSANSSQGNGRQSKVSTLILDMSLDHDSGEMDGTIREGPFTGRKLSQLEQDELRALLIQCRADDAQSAALLETWFDRTQGDDWRDRMGAGHAHSDEQSNAPPDASMSVAEARDILGVDDAAGHDEIVAAHRKLMQKLHPDRGGSTYLATKVNLAKELLLKAS